ncbi:ABC transporter permease [Sporomusa sp.]|jgi:phospholipid/cholesterol/gamma-HCH transport system permease protein|uniref:MlaE family ABC transporter permease n=1 Tax=Sporomusa sp. TaxID=2078658 RepID=UPI002C418DCE|nr:ABC transporter permease [Sporomusa sp.]HWR09152.1 ABC transporter permease [Sporomusa sp.]
MLNKLFTHTGRIVIEFLENVGQVLILFSQTVIHLRQLNTRLLLRQMAHLGADSLAIVLLTMLFTGMVMTVQTAFEFVKYGAQSSVGGLVAVAMARELAPVLTGVVFAGRVGAAITAEIGSMKVTEQIDALRVMAVNPISYLVLPRLVACMVMLPVLVIFANVIGSIGSYMVARYYADISSFTFFNSIKVFAVPHDIIGGMIKAMFFGAIVAIIGCHKGLTTAQGAEGVGQATTGSVVLSITLIFVSNYFLSVLLYR